MRQPLALALAALAACGAPHDSLSREFLKPRAEWLAGPADLGLSFEEVSLPVDGVTLHGWFIPHDQSRGRTVVLLHGSAANISFYHPYYTFLHDAGFNVFLYDYRGYGKSTGEVSIRSLVTDFPPVYRWLRERPDVSQIALYGISLGTIPALTGAARFDDVQGLVLEDVVSATDNIREGLSASGSSSAGSTLGSWGLQYSLPDNIEPDGNAAQIERPILFLAGELEPQIDRFAAYRTFLSAKGLAALWLMPQTGHAPHSLLTHDGEYQQAVVRFLDTLFEGDPERVVVETTEAAAGAAGRWLDVTLQRGGNSDEQPWAVQICAIDKEGSPSFHRVWLQSARETFRINVPGEPNMVTAARYRDALSDADGEGWVRQDSQLARSGQVWDRLEVELDVLQNGQPSVSEVLDTAAKIEVLEEELGPFHPLLESQLAGGFYWIGERLLSSGDASKRAEAAKWLQRSVAAMPAKPELHYWPGRPYVAGFPWNDEVEKARQLLARM